MRYKKTILFVGFSFILVLSFGIIANATDIADISIEEDADVINNKPFEYIEINNAVEVALTKIPAKHLELQISMSSRSNGNIKEHISAEKIAFRNLVESALIKDNTSDADIISEAKKTANIYKQSINVAKNKYDITVTENEVDQYINENITVLKNEEQENYAKALGTTPDKLDYGHYRDLYIMDVLWDKLLFKLVEVYPQKEEESADAHIERIKKSFYENIDM